MALTKKGKDFWGEPCWTTLHVFTATYTPDKKEEFLDYVRILPVLLPCAKCGNHFRANAIKYDVRRYLGSNHELFFWGYLMHDAVNQSHNHEVKVGMETVDTRLKYSPPYEEVKSFYFRALSEECKLCQGE